MSSAEDTRDVAYTPYEIYDRQRQRRLLGAIIPFGFVLTAIAWLVGIFTLIIQTQQTLSLWLNSGLTFGLMVLFIYAWVALRRDWLRQSTLIAIGASGSAVFITVAISALTQGLTPLGLMQIAFLTSVIVLVGVLGNIYTIVGATIVMNVSTILLLIYAPRPAAIADLLRENLTLLASVSFTYQWAVAALMIAIWLTTRQTLQALGTAIEQAQQLDALKDQFITHINHELRTPIMTLQGYVEYLHLAYRDMPPQEVEETFQRATKMGDRLVYLLSSILDVRRIDEKASIIPEIVPLRTAIEAALLSIDPREVTTGARDIRLNIPEGLNIWAEPVRVQQILSNLISNAVKYSPSNTPISVSARMVRVDAPPSQLKDRTAPTTRNMVDIAVRDKGLGIPPEQAPLLFNRFVRLPRDLASNIMGNGLGLYICRVMAETMGGMIWVESAGVEGDGSTFIVRLPLPPEA